MGLDMYLYKGREEVMYWRKANQIHSWFVRECQGGRDECQKSPVRSEQLHALLHLVEKALAEKDPSGLEPVGGFGSTDIDEWYWRDLETTATGLRALLAEPDADSAKYYYRAWW